MAARLRGFARFTRPQQAVLALAVLGALLCPRIAGSHTITGHITADNEVNIYTAAAEIPGMTVNYSGVTTCWPTAVNVNISTVDSYLYLTCYSDLASGQGLLHDLQIDGNLAASGNVQWKVLPADSAMAACVAPPAGVIQAAMAARIPTGVFVAPAVGCQNLAAGCYGVWGQVPTISSAAKWTWFDSGAQVSPNAPFQPGFNHREFLIFRLDMEHVVPTTKSSWGQLKSIYR